MVKSVPRASRRFFRSPYRVTGRGVLRRVSHACFRNLAARRLGPDDLTVALMAFKRAIRAHRRLAKLAPHWFDATAINRAEQQRQTDSEWHAMWEPAFERVYGPSTETWPEPAAPTPLSTQTLRAVDHHYDLWCVWLSAGSDALARYRQRRPHALPSLSRVARLIEIGITLGRLACGDLADPDTASESHAKSLADLNHCYGDKSTNESSGSALGFTVLT